jgi:hypothetical protein
MMVSMTSAPEGPHLVRLSLQARQLVSICRAIRLEVSDQDVAELLVDVVDQRRLDAMLRNWGEALDRMEELLGPPGSVSPSASCAQNSDEMHATTASSLNLGPPAT